MRKFTFDHDEVSSHIGDLVDVRDEHGALLFACPAARARPENVWMNDVRYEVDSFGRFGRCRDRRICSGAGRAAGVSNPRTVRPRGVNEFIFSRIQVIAKGQREVLRTENLTRPVRRAVV